MKKFIKRIRVFFIIHDVKYYIFHPLRFLYQIRFCSKIRVWWNFLWIRKNEFHSSLDMDGVAMLKMSDKEKKKYFSELTHRRQLTRESDLD